MKFIRENEVSDVYQCETCSDYISIAKGCDVPECDCGGDEE